MVKADKLPGIAQTHRLQGFAIGKFLDAKDNIREIVAEHLRKLPDCFVRQALDGRGIRLMRDPVIHPKYVGTPLPYFYRLMTSSDARDGTRPAFSLGH